MITLDLSILNQKGTPMFNSDIFANRPTFGIAGRIFISTDTLEIYRDTGSSWTLLGGGGGGGTISGTIAAGQVAFGTAANTIGGTNNLYWDNASTFLGINTNTPNNNLVVNTIVSDGGILLKQNNTSIGELIRVGTNNYSKLLLINAGVNNIDINSGGFSYIRQNNFAIGSNTDTGQKFQVTGTSNFVGNITLPLNQNAATGLTISNNTSGTAANSFLKLQTTDASTYGEFSKLSSAYTTYKIFVSNDLAIYNTNTSGDIAILNDFATGRIKFSAGGSSNAQATLFSNGNFAIASTTDNGQKFQVIGSARIGTNSGSAMYWDDTNNRLGIGTSSPARPLSVIGNISCSSGVLTPSINSEGATFAFGGATVRTIMQTTLPDGFALNIENSGTGQTRLIGNLGSYSTSHTFAPPSGTATYASYYVANTINQTGGANGVTRGLYVNPTLTAAADFRAIEWNNNTTWGIYGAGTAPSYFAGNVQIGSTTAIASNVNLQVTGLAHILDTRTYTSGTIQSFVVQKNTTINSAISSSSGICNYVSTGDNGISSSQSVPASTSFANIYAFNKYQFNSAGLTLTQTQGSPGVRSISQLFTQNVFKGANNGTITHMSGIQIGGYYNDNTGTITPVITNAYQLLINDTGAYGHTFTLTNRWGIYQEGINDRNYLAGNLMLNSTTDTGQILQVSGAIRVNGQSSGTAGVLSGNYLIINVDGTSYKIALLNP